MKIIIFNRLNSEIERALCLFDGLTFDRMGIDHGRSDIAVAQ